MNKLTNVESKDDFARLLGFSNSRFMNYVLYVLRTEELYETFTIPKKSGGERTINAPKKELKILVWMIVIFSCDGVVIKKNFIEYVTVPKILNAKEAVAGVLWAAVIMETEQLKK